MTTIRSLKSGSNAANMSTGQRNEPDREEFMTKDFGKIAETSLLYDFYGALLTDKQREVMALYHEENLSLSEHNMLLEIHCHSF